MPKAAELVEAKKSLLESDLKIEANEKQPKRARDIDIKEFYLGVWHIKVAVPRGRLAVKHYVDSFRSSMPLIKRLVVDIWSLSPSLFIIYLFCKIWRGIEEALLMHLTGTLLRKVLGNSLNDILTEIFPG